MRLTRGRCLSAKSPTPASTYLSLPRIRKKVSVSTVASAATKEAALKAISSIRCIGRHDLPGLSFLPDHHSPGHRLVLDKHHDGFGDLLWLKQNRRDRLLALFGRHLGATSSGGWGVHPTWADAVDADAHLLLQGSERSGETHHPSFGRAVLGCVIGLETDPTHGRDVHDRPTPAFSHGANTEVYAQHHAA